MWCIAIAFSCWGSASLLPLQWLVASAQLKSLLLPPCISCDKPSSPFRGPYFLSAGDLSIQIRITHLLVTYISLCTILCRRCLHLLKSLVAPAYRVFELHNQSNRSTTLQNHTSSSRASLAALLFFCHAYSHTSALWKLSLQLYRATTTNLLSSLYMISWRVDGKK